ncbi:hypothetical protein CTAYLR_000506 [Chrysophaeum taylorii]|uniref:Aquaporin n=1 Tax=Chrysophaeum taylorii TaxID=2483200 RepID=A0AAD7UI13_9STRA|nr:hypothetical protein CTAYLR_000506 [Chrysophaeum taylorii]
MIGKVDLRAVVAEFLAMAMFVVIGCGVASANGAFDAASRLVVANAFGIGILVLAYTFAAHSGAQINCAVTFSLVLGGNLDPIQGVANFVAQMAGSLLGGLVLCAIFPCSEDMTGNLGTNIVNPAYGNSHAFAGETFGTFLLCLVVWETAVSKFSISGNIAPLAIGFAVFLAHILLLPIDGCSINPTRSFGPAIVSYVRDCESYVSGGMKDLWVFWVGPLFGAAIAAAVKVFFAKPKFKETTAPGGDEGKDIIPSNDV